MIPRVAISIRRLMLLVGMACLVVVQAGCDRASSKDRAHVVAAVGDAQVSVDDFRSAYVDYLLRTGIQDSPAFRRTFLNKLVGKAMVVQEARHGGIEGRDAYRHHRETVETKLLLNGYVGRNVYDTVSVSEADLEDMFVRVNTQIKARHLYARTQDEADALYDRLQQGASFEKLAREVFDDTTLANNGGSLGYFGFDEMDPYFEDAAFGLKTGEVSPPVRTAEGYSIIQVQDRFTHPLLTESAFAKKRRSLNTFVLRRKQTMARTAYLRSLAEALDVTFQQEAFETLLGQITGTNVVADEERFNKWLADPLLTYRDGERETTWSVGDFREKAAHTDPRQRARVRTAQDLEDFARGLVTREVIVERARAEGLDRTDDYRRQRRKEMDDWIYRTATGEIAASVTVPDDSIRAEYEAHRDTYVVPAKVHLHEIMTATQDEAEALVRELDHTSFTELAREHSIRPGADATGGDLGFVSAAQLDDHAETILGADEAAVVGPLAVNGRFVLLKVGERTPARPMTFAEARDTIARALHDRAASAAVERQLNALRDRYEVRVNAQLLASLPLRRSKPSSE